MNVVNLTGHMVRVLSSHNGVVRVIPTHGPPARCITADEVLEPLVCSLDDEELVVEQCTSQIVAVVGLPLKEQAPPNTGYLVSRLVLEAIQMLKLGDKYPPVFAPDTGAASVLRDHNKRVYAVRRFIRGV